MPRYARNDMVSQTTGTVPTVHHCERSDSVIASAAILSLRAQRSNLILKGDTMRKDYYVYILTNYTNTVLYTGVTNNLRRRVYEHKEKIADSFTKKYNINKLVYYEVFNDIKFAIEREKQIKGGSRKKKIELIDGLNKDWEDLYPKLL
ncbi:MAG: GIY-YIG nuclease family protein [Syntrophomonadaceae bacterium]|nr:GIY-YIG nuclease family protein [Syntrophomonadaceae bacterium]